MKITCQYHINTCEDNWLLKYLLSDKGWFQYMTIQCFQRQLFPQPFWTYTSSFLLLSFYFLFCTENVELLLNLKHNSNTNSMKTINKYNSISGLLAKFLHVIDAVVASFISCIYCFAWHYICSRCWSISSQALTTCVAHLIF